MTKKDFTLTELLMVIAVAFFLCILTLPLLEAAQNTEPHSACMAQLKLTAAAHQNYLNDNKGFFIPYQGATISKLAPGTRYYGGKAKKWQRSGGYADTDALQVNGSAFVPVAMGYMEQDFSAFYCPGDSRARLEPCRYSGNNSYAYSLALGKGQNRDFPNFDTPNIKDIDDPAGQILFGESAAGKGVIARTAAGKGWMFFKNTEVVDRAHKPHGDLYNFVFTDGHVTAWTYDETLQKDENFNSGL